MEQLAEVVVAEPVLDGPFQGPVEFEAVVPQWRYCVAVAAEADFAEASESRSVGLAF